MLHVQNNKPSRKTDQETLNSRFLMHVYENDFANASRCLAQGAEINTRGRHNETALCYAARQGYTALALLLIDQRAQVNSQDRDGNTALIHAVQRNDITIAKKLIAADADITVENKDGGKALDFAFKLRNTEMVQLFERPLKQLLLRIPITRGVDTADPRGDTILTWAARMGQVSVVRALVESGTNVEVPNKLGETALDIARSLGHHRIIEILSDIKGSA